MRVSNLCLLVRQSLAGVRQRCGRILRVWFPRILRLAIASATVAHVLGWAAFLWLVPWPDLYEGGSFTEFNGYRSVLALFVPVVVTGLVLMFLLTRTVRRGANEVVVWGLAAVLLVFCGLGYLSFGVMYLPAAIALIVTAVAFGRGRGLSWLNDQ